MTAKLNFEWKIDESPYSNGKYLYIGKWKVGGVHWDACSKDKKYKPTCKLPGIKSSLDNFEIEQLAMDKLEFVVEYWFIGLNIQELS